MYKMKNLTANVSMVLMTCDKYEDTWNPFFSQLKVNWPEFNMPIYLGSETKTFSFLGFNINCPLSREEPIEQWSMRLLKLIDKIDTEYILFFLDDFWLSQKVDNNCFNKIFSYMQENNDIGFVCLLHEEKKFITINRETLITSSEYDELNEWKKGLPFRITTQAGLWKKSYLIKLLRAHESVWYFETRATWRSKFCKERVFNVKDNLLNYPVGGVIGGGKLYKDYLHLYPKEITDMCSERGLIDFCDSDKRRYPQNPKGIKYYWDLLLSALPKI